VVHWTGFGKALASLDHQQALEPPPKNSQPSKVEWEDRWEELSPVGHTINCNSSSQKPPDERGF
jgi:hypothetical protein